MIPFMQKNFLFNVINPENPMSMVSLKDTILKEIYTLLRNGMNGIPLFQSIKTKRKDLWIL